LRGKPIAVGGSEQRGVVCAASYEARKFGVRSAMSGMMAKRLCPHLIFVKPRFDAYRLVSQQIREIFFDYTDLVEPLSLDEAYLDVTADLKGIKSATLTANEIRARILETTGVTASAGISYNKFLAKMASDVNKPNGFKIITPDEADDFIMLMPIEKFYGVGQVTARKMKSSGIFNGADLKTKTLEQLCMRFGKAGLFYYKIVRGQDDRVVNPFQIQKSIGAEETFGEDLTNLEDMKSGLDGVIDDVFRRVQKHENYGRTLTLKIKKADFQSITRSKSFQYELKSKADISTIAHELLAQVYPELEHIRLIGISFSNLTKEKVLKGIQLELDLEDRFFNESEPKILE
jgi:DNA polymerase-4